MASDAKGATSFEEGLKGASEKVAEFHEDKGALKRLQTWLHQTPSAVPMIGASGAISAVIAVFALIFSRSQALATPGAVAALPCARSQCAPSRL